MNIDEALEYLEAIARSPSPPPKPAYYLHLCHDGARDSFCGQWIGTFVGTKNSKGQHEVVASPETVHPWNTYNHELCLECVKHEDYPLFLLGSI